MKKGMRLQLANVANFGLEGLKLCWVIGLRAVQRKNGTMNQTGLRLEILSKSAKMDT